MKWPEFYFQDNIKPSMVVLDFNHRIVTLYAGESGVYVLLQLNKFEANLDMRDYLLTNKQIIISTRLVFLII